MAQRKRIALIFNVNKNWMGGTYYILNLINALNTLPDRDKPEILLLCQTEDDYKYAWEYTSYPHLSCRLTFKPKRFDMTKIVNRIYNKIFHNGNLLYLRRFDEKVDVIYPVLEKYQLKSPSPILHWIPDFQELHFPEYFSKFGLKYRKAKNKALFSSGNPVVFSSYDALKDAHEFYPESKNVKTPVLHFASEIPQYDINNKNAIFKKFNIDRPFLLCANQLWVHKNHMTLFKAVNLIKQQGHDILVLCSGGKKDHRNPEYHDSLEKYISDNNLSDNIKLLGLIERDELVCLMNECISIVQPSLFEGWNTGVEEAKAINKYLILSDIPVHREQVTQNATFFNPYDETELSEKLLNAYKSAPSVVETDYNRDIHKVAKDFIKIIDNF